MKNAQTTKNDQSTTLKQWLLNRNKALVASGIGLVVWLFGLSDVSIPAAVQPFIGLLITIALGVGVNYIPNIPLHDLGQAEQPKNENQPGDQHHTSE